MLSYASNIGASDKISLFFFTPSFLEKLYKALTSDSLKWLPKGIVSYSHRYSLKVISVKDSIVIAKLLEINPWTRVNVGDGISLD